LVWLPQTGTKNFQKPVKTGPGDRRRGGFQQAWAEFQRGKVRSRGRREGPRPTHLLPLACFRSQKAGGRLSADWASNLRFRLSKKTGGGRRGGPPPLVGLSFRWDWRWGVFCPLHHPGGPSKGKSGQATTLVLLFPGGFPPGSRFSQSKTWVFADEDFSVEKKNPEGKLQEKRW